MLLREYTVLVKGVYALFFEATFELCPKGNTVYSALKSLSAEFFKILNLGGTAD